MMSPNGTLLIRVIVVALGAVSFLSSCSATPPRSQQEVGSAAQKREYQLRQRQKAKDGNYVRIYRQPPCRLSVSGCDQL